MLLSLCLCYRVRCWRCAPLSEVRQLLGLFCILASQLEPRFEQRRNTVKITAWFLHLPCHPAFPDLLGRRFTPSAFMVPAALTQHGCAQALHRPRLSHPLLCITANTHPAPGWDLGAQLWTQDHCGTQAELPRSVVAPKTGARAGR